ncbi:MAG: hypothetical protein IPM29_08635 [Planctomycetes bacterium]|nr:hypothetical protein [Planctomycetota bacterium]
MQPEPRPGRAAIAAAVRLLADEDSAVARRVGQRILQWGESARCALDAAARHDDPRLRCRARVLLRRLDVSRAADGFVRAVSRAAAGRDAGVALLDGLLALQELVRSRRDGGRRAVRRIDELADEVRAATRGVRSTETVARRLTDVLADGHGLEGREIDELADISEQQLLDDVLDRCHGPSSMLCAIYLLVARRAGLDATPVRVHGFHLVRLHGRRRVLVDPFHQGRSVTRVDCLRYLRDLGDPQAGLHRLRDVSDADVLVAVVEDLALCADARRDIVLRGALLRALDAARPYCRLRPRTTGR